MREVTVTPQAFHPANIRVTAKADRGRQAPGTEQAAHERRRSPKKKPLHPALRSWQVLRHIGTTKEAGIVPPSSVAQHIRVPLSNQGRPFPITLRTGRANEHYSVSVTYVQSDSSQAEDGCHVNHR